MKNISLNLWKRNELLTARKYHFHVPINNCMKHVPRRRLLANFFVLPSYVILLYDVQFCNTNTPTYPIILYHKHKKLKACVCPFNFDKTYPFYLMRISCSKVFNHQAVEEKKFDGCDDVQFVFVGHNRHICNGLDYLLFICHFWIVYDSRWWRWWHTAYEVRPINVVICVPGRFIH